MRGRFGGGTHAHVESHQPLPRPLVYPSAPKFFRLFFWPRFLIPTIDPSQIPILLKNDSRMGAGYIY